MASDPRNRNGAARRALRARIRAMGMPCGICGLPIDYSLPAGHPMAFEVDEIVPVSKGGSPIDPANCQAAHRICNQRRGNRPLQAARAECGGASGSDACSRDWRRPGAPRREPERDPYVLRVRQCRPGRKVWRLKR